MSAFGGKADMRRLSAVVGDARRKRIEADIITGPPWPLERRAFPAAVCANCAGAQSVARGIRAPPDDGDCASERRMVLIPLGPQPDPRASIAVAHRAWA